jgi:tetratricopeptide (TPR) repeat protein
MWAPMRRAGGAALALAALLAGPAPARSAEAPAAAALAQAIADLGSADASVRERACVLLGESAGRTELPRLFQALREDASPGVRHAAERAIWRIWSRSGDARTDRVFAAGLAQMQAGDLREAALTFGEVIEMRPGFAEGWNKRATVYFLMGDLDRSLSDCDEVIRRNPDHFGALAGYGQIYTQKGDLAAALAYYERALAINPNMSGVRASVEAIRRALAEQRRRYI